MTDMRLYHYKNIEDKNESSTEYDIISHYKENNDFLGIIRKKFYYDRGTIYTNVNFDNHLKGYVDEYIKNNRQHNSSYIITGLYEESNEDYKKLLRHNPVFVAFTIDPKTHNNIGHQVMISNDHEELHDHMKTRGWDETSVDDESNYYMYGYFFFIDKKDYVKALLIEKDCEPYCTYEKPIEE